MPETATGYEHIIIDERGIARITGTRWKVSLLVAARQAYGWSPEELHFQHPDLTLGQIYSALAYSADHTDAIEAEISRDLAAYEEARGAAAPSPIIEKLRARGLRK